MRRRVGRVYVWVGIMVLLGLGLAAGPLLAGMGFTPPSPSPSPTFTGLTLSDNGQVLATLNSYTATAGNGALLNAHRARGTSGGPTAAQANDLLGGVVASGYGATGFGSGNAAVLGYASEAFSDSAQGTFLTLETTPNGSITRAIRVSVTNAGDVGIGNTTPDAGGLFSPGLAVGPKTGTNLQGGIEIHGSVQANSTDVGVLLIQNASTNLVRIHGARESAFNTGALVFDTAIAGTLGERWRITSAGHFLSGTDNTYDLGASGATRPRDGWFGRDLSAGQHYRSSGTAPGVSGSCGSGPAISGTDNAGKVTTGTGAPTSCTVTFAVAWPSAPACIANNETTASLSRATSTTTTVVLSGTMVAGDVLTYHCLGGS